MGERLLYIAVVADKIGRGDYYRRAEYRHRPDSIYRWDGSRFIIRTTARYHADGRSIGRDLGTHTLSQRLRASQPGFPVLWPQGIDPIQKALAHPS